MTSTTTAMNGPDARPDGRPHRTWITVALLLAGLWAWAVAGCADEWTDNPMYSYGWFVPPLVLFFAWRRLDEPLAGRIPFGDPALPTRRGLIMLFTAILAVFVLPAELLRNELPDDRLNNWAIAGVAVGTTLWVVRCVGGRHLVGNLAFPIAFFLTAVAWPKRYETPVTVGLQGFVTDFVVEVMHILGIQADPHGNTIYLRNGPVGIAEACSGIRSLQASLMISIAIGELFYLRLTRRLVLIVLCAIVATILNLSRTLSLCLITEYQGAAGMHKAHDFIGNAILLILPVLSWGIGRLLAGREGALPTSPLPRRPGADGTPPPPSHWQRLRQQIRGLDWRRMPNFLPTLVIGLAAFSTYHVWLEILDRRDPPQQTPFFTARTGNDTGVEKIETNSEVWTILSPTSGGSYVARNPSFPSGRISLYHFFWKPAAANRWVTGHRPDICMPAGGWQKAAEPEPIEVDFDGRKLRFTLFRFTGVGQHALQIWGIWRNGQPIEMDFFRNPTLEWSLLTGKSRSAVEVVSCVVPYAGGDEPLDFARQLVKTAFEYHRTTGQPAATAAIAGPNTAAATPPAPAPRPGTSP